MVCYTIANLLYILQGLIFLTKAKILAIPKELAPCQVTSKDVIFNISAKGVILNFSAKRID